MISNIEETLSNMTLEEKARLVCGSSFFGMAGVPSQNIPGVQVLDGGTGINYEQLLGDMFDRWHLDIPYAEQRNVIFNYFKPDRLSDKELKTRQMVKEKLNNIFTANTVNNETAQAYMSMPENNDAYMMSPGCFPTGMMLGATFNPDIVNQVGHALGREARAHGIQLLLGTPNINIHRDPLNGRLFEGYSEDPCLVAVLAPEMVTGVQAEGVAANIKHFAANNQEKNRQGINEIISERSLHEIYFPGFKACVEKAHAATVMSAYNKINGIPCTENKWLLDDILRTCWGFDGMVVSDWGAVYNQIQALKAGNDVNMPGPVDCQPILDAIESGELSEAELDISAGRVLKLISEYTDMPPYDMSCQCIMDMSKQAAYKAACEGIVMLKNENNIFPLNNGRPAAGDSAFDNAHGERVILCGSGALRLYDCGTGSAGITTDKTSSIYECLVENGVNASIGIPPESSNVTNNIDTYICVARIAGMEGNDRKDMNLQPEDAQVLNRLVDIKRNNPKVKTGLILNVCGPVDLSLWENSLDGIFCMFLPGMEGGHAMADILTGRVNPSGKLPVTFPKKYKDTPTCLNFPGDGYQVYYGEGIYVGYRYYDKKQVTPMYPFGYGLSYSSFSIYNQRSTTPATPIEVVYPDGRVESRVMPVFSDSIKIAVDVENKGPALYAEGMETVQLYISDMYSHLSKPVKELKAFKKVRLGCGEKTTVTFELNVYDFASFDGDLHQWTVEEGMYNILIGNSSRNITCSLMVYLNVSSQYSYSHQSTIKELYENAVTREHMWKLWDKMELDHGDILTTYEYGPNTTLYKLMLQKNIDEAAWETAISEFNMRVGSIRKA
jgi:beta-glucosidase